MFSLDRSDPDALLGAVLFRCDLLLQSTSAMDLVQNLRDPDALLGAVPFRCGLPDQLAIAGTSALPHTHLRWSAAESDVRQSWALRGQRMAAGHLILHTAARTGELCIAPVLVSGDAVQSRLRYHLRGEADHRSDPWHRVYIAAHCSSSVYTVQSCRHAVVRRHRRGRAASLPASGEHDSLTGRLAGRPRSWPVASTCGAVPGPVALAYHPGYMSRNER